uniref:Saposin B-type domain-containing protein n=1 Tax=Rhabditophanes sp. KR3021 TaxID=114890 RepID=A0AC35TZN3_9BILA
MSKLIIFVFCILAVTNIYADPLSCNMCEGVLTTVRIHYDNNDHVNNGVTPYVNDLIRLCFAFSQSYKPQAMTTCLKIVDNFIGQSENLDYYGRNACSACIDAKYCAATDNCGQ